MRAGLVCHSNMLIQHCLPSNILLRFALVSMVISGAMLYYQWYPPLLYYNKYLPSQSNGTRWFTSFPSFLFTSVRIGGTLPFTPVVPPLPLLLFNGFLPRLLSYHRTNSCSPSNLTGSVPILFAVADSLWFHQIAHLIGIFPFNLVKRDSAESCDIEPFSKNKETRVKSVGTI